MTEAQAIKIYDNLKHLRGLIQQRRRLSAQVFEHPDATANEIMALHEKSARALTDERKMFRHAISLIQNKLPYRYNVDALHL